MCPEWTQRFLEDAIVFDDAVVYDQVLAGTVGVGMGILGSGFAVGGPAGVTNARTPLRDPSSHARYQGSQLAGLFLDHGPARAVDDSDSRAIVASVLKAAEGVKQYRAGGAGSNVSYNSTHRLGLSVYGSPELHDTVNDLVGSEMGRVNDYGVQRRFQG